MRTNITMKWLAKVSAFLLIVMSFAPILAIADTVPVTPRTPNTTALPSFTNPLKFNSVEQLIFGLVDVALQIGVVVAALSLIWVGFMYVAARGNPKKVSDAHQAFLYTVIGIAILFGSKVIIEIIKGTLSPFLAPDAFRNINR